MCDDQHGLAAIVAAIGTGGFGPAVMVTLKRNAGADMCSGFARRGTAPEVVLAQSADPAQSPFARIAPLRYASHYWRRDTDTLYNLGRAHRNVLTARRAARSIRDIDYRLECYSEGAVAERISICRAEPVGVILNAYRHEAVGPFTETAFEWIEAHGPILIAATLKHCEVTRQSRLPAKDAAGTMVGSLLNLPGAELSLREAQALADAAMGASQAESAARMGLAPTSIATYRRRGYAKLGVQTRAELRARLWPHAGSA